MKFLIGVFFLLFSINSHAQDDSIPANPTANSCNCGNEIFSFAEQMPQFPGGEASFQKYLKDNLIYPAAAIEAKKSGVVYINFIVDSAGNVCDVQVAKGIRAAPELDQEAVRVMRASPKWIPGKMNGVNVCVSFTVPVSFKLPE